MPLSEHEQKLLDEIEQALYAEDPKFAASVRSARSQSKTKRALLLSVLGVLAGLGLVLIGLVGQIIALSVVGFLLVVGSCGYAASALRGTKTAVTPAAAANTVRQIRPTGLRSRMEDRIRRRFDEGA